MKLIRGHGLGNDYLVLAEGQALDPELVRALCHRHTGVGGDGVLEPIDGADCDYGVRIWNPDGSVAEKSGNGLRIYARWLRDRGAKDHFSVWTGFERASCRVLEDTVVVDMGTARFDGPGEEAVVLGDGELVGTSLSVGNPHFVVFADDLDSIDWRRWGAELEVHRRFPARTNAQFVRRLGARSLDIRIWERGAGETSASGSSSCAAAAAGVRTGRLTGGDIQVHMPGGMLEVHVGADFAITLAGPVEIVGAIEVDERWLSARGNPSGR